MVPNTYTTLDLDLLISRNLYISNHIIIDPISGIGDPNNMISPPDDGTGGNSNTTGGNPGDPVYVTSMGEAISPTVVVTLKRPDGSVIATQTFSNLSTTTPVFCDRFVPKHVSFAYTTGAESHVVVEITPSHNLSVVPAGQFQQIFIDNVHLRGATQTKVAFFYNDRGHRIKKVSYGLQSTATTTYVCDASGSVMAIHQQEINPSIRTRPVARVEHPVYGASRIGIFKREGTAGFTLYELTDHLGNVRAVIRKTPTGLLSLTSKTDYYPFGMPMPNRQTTDNNYRYAFQGQEKDNETGMEAFELRLWDGRIGRWLTVDPYHEFFSPYVGMGNNPINLIDPDGGSTGGPGDDEIVYNGGTLSEIVVVGQRKFKDPSSWTSELTYGDWYDYTMTPASYEAKYGSGAMNNYTNEDYQKWIDWTHEMDKRVMRDQAKDWFNNLNLFVQASKDAVSVMQPAGMMKAIKFGRKLYKPKFKTTLDVGTDNLLAAGNTIDKGGLTAVGRALQKHGSRLGSLFPKVSGNAKAINSQGEAILKGILYNPKVVSSTRYHARLGEVLEFRVPNGQGARFSSDGKSFIGFLE